MIISRSDSSVEVIDAQGFPAGSVGTSRGERGWVAPETVDEARAADVEANSDMNKIFRIESRREISKSCEFRVR